MQRAVGYLRVSPASAAENDTIENQRTFLIRYCQQHAIDLIDIYEDDQVTGALPMEHRRGGGRLLRDAESGRFDVILIYAIDRLGRDQIESLLVARQLNERGLQLLSMTEPFDTRTPMGMFFFSLMAGKAEMERHQILARTALGKQKAAEEGRWNGGRRHPYGYRLEERHLVPYPPHAEVVRRIFALAAEGMSAGAVGRLLTAEGIPGPDSEVWGASTVRRILANRLYTGEAVYRTFQVIRSRGESKLIRSDPSAHISYTVPALITVEQFQRAQQALQIRRPERRRSYDYLLTGFLRCSCGAPMGGTAMTRGAHVYRYYRCSSRERGACQPCGGPKIPSDAIEAAVWAQIEGYIREPEMLLGELRQTAHQLVEPFDEIASAEQALAAKAVEQERITGAYTRGILGADADAILARELLRIKRESQELTERLEDLQARELRQRVVAEQLAAAEETLHWLSGLTREPDFDTRRRALQRLLETIVVRSEDDQITLTVTCRPCVGPREQMCRRSLCLAYARTCFL